MILLRHAQTVFNVVFGETRQDPGVRDPSITEAGLAQARATAEKLKAEPVRRIIASPYRRTLQTAEIIAGALNVEVTIEPLVRERAHFACDIGTARSELTRAWSDYSFDHLDEVWWSTAQEPVAVLHERCDRFRAAMAAEEEWRHVVVITHWGVIRALTGRRIQNCETVRFDPTAENNPPDDGGKVVTY